MRGVCLGALALLAAAPVAAPAAESLGSLLNQIAPAKAPLFAGTSIQLASVATERS